MLAAALDLWERRDTELVIASVDPTQDAATRLRGLLTLAFASSAQQGTPPQLDARAIELALQASASHPLVAPALLRVTTRRLDFLTTLYAEVGLSRRHARQQALLAYTAFLGHSQLAHATPELLPRGRGSGHTSTRSSRPSPASPTETRTRLVRPALPPQPGDLSSTSVAARASRCVVPCAEG